MPIEDQSDRLRSILIDLMARNLEQSFKDLRKTVKDFTANADRIIHSVMENPKNAAGLNNQARSLPPIRVGLNLLQDTRNNLQRLIDRDLSTDEVEQLARRGVPTSPFDYLHNRKRHMVIKSQTDMIKEINHYVKTLDDLTAKAVHLSGPDEHELFQEQYKFLPSFSRRKVMFGYPLTGGQ